MKSRISVIYSEETRVRLFIPFEESATVTKYYKGVTEVTEEEQGLKSLRSIALRTTKSSAWLFNQFGHSPKQL